MRLPDRLAKFLARLLSKSGDSVLPYVWNKWCKDSEPNPRVLCRKKRQIACFAWIPRCAKTVARDDMEWVQAAWRAEAASKLVI